MAYSYRSRVKKSHRVNYVVWWKPPSFVSCSLPKSYREVPVTDGGLSLNSNARLTPRITDAILIFSFASLVVTYLIATFRIVFSFYYLWFCTFDNTLSVSLSYRAYSISLRHLQSLFHRLRFSHWYLSWLS